MTKDRAQHCRAQADSADSDNERIAWDAAAKAWDSCKLLKPALTARGRQLAALYSIGRQLATVQSAEPAPEPPTTSPPEPTPEPVKPAPKGAFATIEF